MEIQVLERVPEEEVNKLIKNGRHRYRHEHGQGAWCRFRGDLVEGIAYIGSPRVADNPPRAHRLPIVGELSDGIYSLLVTPGPEEVRNFRKLEPDDALYPAMRYLSVPGHFWVRGYVTLVYGDDDGTTVLVDVAAGDATFTLDSADVGGETELSILAEGDAVEFEACFLALYEEGRL